MPRSPYYSVSALFAILLLVLSAKSNDFVVAAFLTENRFCAARPIPSACTCTLLVKQHPNNVCVFRVCHTDSYEMFLYAKMNDKDEYDDKYLGALDRAVQTGDTRKLGKRKKFWVERCLELAEYKRKHGNCDVRQPTRRGEKKTKLQNWIPHQRTAYRLYQQGEDSSMTEEKIAILEGMGFRWEITGWSGDHASWKVRYEELIEYKWKYGDCNVPEKWEKNPKLATWVSNQREEYRYLQEGELSFITDERVAMLEKLDFEWNVNVDWELRYEELEEYKKQYGDCNVPQRWDENPQLGQWVKKQRAQYRLLKEGKKSDMTAERIALLEKLDFDWYINGPQVDWELRYEELKQYKDRYGHCNVPRGWKENPKLGNWVNSQRKQYRLLKEGKKSDMTAERIVMLEKLDFDWHVKGPQVDWEVRYDELKRYQEQYGNCNVPKGWKENPKLANWVHTQRKQYRLLKEGKPSTMTNERIHMLEKIGFEWVLRGKRKQTK